ncbi:type I-E CRISPR-associated protein Cse1/CasA [Streptomyces alkaliphilus]|uniref:Type I-E CRISPR-associated protein Cse1/CasA n=1 Tax=Streptomyces alkaliphilus TaxID=1472722 RepID=A0A7W3THM5_9ACTN|nr:type I-E CRISPR-associated protein Cse1/CasA [Streptomyces alkaliphilus]
MGAGELLLHAERYRDLAVDLPTQKPAVLRQVLLPILVDALGYPGEAGDWLAMMRAGALTPEQRDTLTAYLGEHRARFDLFDPVDPFAQVAGLRTTKGETKGSALLVATAATGNNVPLFASRTEGDPLELTPAQAARWLLHTHCWDTAAIKTGAVGDPRVKAGKTTGNPTGPLGQLGVVMPLGSTLFETLVLNIPFGRTRLSDDLPQWRRRDTTGRVEDTLSCALPAWRERASRGPLDLWTWQSRRIRLIPEDTPAGVRVTRVVVAAGDRLTVTPDHEPHTAWRLTPTPKRPRTGAAAKRPIPAELPRRHQTGKAGWRGLEAFLAVDREQRDARGDRAGFRTSVLLDQLGGVRDRLPATYPLRVELTGIAYGNQSAVVEDLYVDSIPLPLVALDPEGPLCSSLLEAAEQAEQLASALNHLSGDLMRAAGSEPIPWDRGQRPGETLLYALDAPARMLLLDLRGNPEDVEATERVLEKWERHAAEHTWKVAEQVLAGTAPGVFSGRRVIKDRTEHVYRLATAEQGFRARLATVLPRWNAARRAARAAASPESTPSRSEG